MRSAFRIFLGLVLLIVIIILSVASADTNNRNRKNRQGSTNSVVCDCRFAVDSPVCASNGVTYPSTCRFECAKRKVKRLRMVSSGSCRGKSLQDYRRNQRGSRQY